jgi:hypothetical protein
MSEPSTDFLTSYSKQEEWCMKYFMADNNIFMLTTLLQLLPLKSDAANTKLALDLDNSYIKTWN